MIRDFELIKDRIQNLTPALDIYYYQRIFNLNVNLYQLGDIYVDSSEFHQRQINLVSIGELFQKSLFHLLEENIVLTYFLFSFVVLCAWIYLILKLMSSEGKNSFIKNFLIISPALVLLFGESNLTKDNYPFARIISPQITVLLWLIGLVLTGRLLSSYKSKKVNYKCIVQFGILTIVASFTYLYTLISILGTGIIILFLLVIKKNYPYFWWFLVSFIFSMVPFILINLLKSKEKRFLDSGERMGLINYRYPGTITTVFLCLVIIFSILIYRYFVSKGFRFTSLESILIISSGGLILASQSNIVTGKEIQFYHFNIFAKANLLLFAILFLNRIRIKKAQKYVDSYKNIFILVLSVLLITNTLNKVIEPIMFKNHFHSSIELLSKKYSSKDKLIVDVVNLQNVFPVYSRAKLLYQSDITTYGFTNEEVLARAYISAGCPSEIDDKLKSEVLVYRLEAIEQKGKTLKAYLEYFNLEELLIEMYNPAFKDALEKRKTVNSEIDKYLYTAAKNSCLSMAKNFGIGTILFDKRSNWYRILKLRDLPIKQFKFQELNLYEYKIT